MSGPQLISSHPAEAADAPGGPATVACRRATFDDFPRIFALEDRFGLGAKRTRAQWMHLWVNNPAWQAVPEWPIGWVLTTPGKEIVGSVAAVPLLYQFKGRSLTASAGHSFVADEHYRGYALLLLQKWASHPEAEVHLGTSVNAKSEMSHVAVGNVRVPAGAWDRAGFWITNHRAFAASALAKSNAGGARLLEYPLAAGTAIADACRRDGIERSRFRGDVISLLRFDDRFDEFWHALLARYPDRFMAVRTREVFDWHFHDAIKNGELWIHALPDGSRLAAYAIFLRRDQRDLRLRRVRLIDFQSLGGEELLLPLLAHAIARCRAEGIAMLENIGWQMQPGGCIERIAPYSRRLPSWQYVYNAMNPELRRALGEPASWNPSQFDGDSTL